MWRNSETSKEEVNLIRRLKITSHPRMTYNSIHIDSRDIEQSFDTVCITDWFTISLDNYAYVMS
jgi:hypothetical protein